MDLKEYVGVCLEIISFLKKDCSKFEFAVRVRRRVYVTHTHTVEMMIQIFDFLYLKRIIPVVNFFPTV